MSEIKHDITMNATCETIFKALTTEEGLKSWFTPEVNGSGEVGTEWELKFTDQPFFRWGIMTSDAPYDVAWKCLEGPGSAPGTEVEYTLTPTPDNKAVLTIIHRGWSEGDPKFEKCVAIWRLLMTHLQQYCEQNKAEPAYH